MNEHLLKRNLEIFKELNILHWQTVTTGKGIKIGIIGFEKGSHHNGADLINQVAKDAEIIEYDVMEEISWEDAFTKMLNDNIDIVCCSLRKRSWTDELEELSKKLYDKGVIMIDSADNEGKEIDAYPALSSYWFVAGAYDEKKNTKAGYSSYGVKLDFLMYTSFANINKSGNYIPISHTSGATQVPCGMVAMLKEYTKGNFGPNEFKRYIEKYSIDLDQQSYDEKTGYGLLSMPGTIIQPTVKIIKMDVVATILNGRFCLPTRFIAEAVKGVTSWNTSTQTGTFIVGNTTIKAKKGSKKLEVEVLDLC